MKRVLEYPKTSRTGRGMLLMLGGVVMGAAAGLLTAPQSGERTRRHIVRKAEDAKAQVVDLYDDVTETVEDVRRGVTEKFAVGKQ